MNGQGTPARPNVSSSSFSGNCSHCGYRLELSFGQDLAQATTLAKLESPISSFQRYAMVVARILVSIIFMMTALNVIGQSFAAHELAANGVSANLVAVLIIAARALQLVAGLGLILGIYPRISALARPGSDTGDPHRTCILVGHRHISLYGSANQLLQECMHGRWPDFHYRGSKSTSSAAAPNAC